MALLTGKEEGGLFNLSLLGFEKRGEGGTSVFEQPSLTGMVRGEVKMERIALPKKKWTCVPFELCRALEKPFSRRGMGICPQG